MIGAAIKNKISFYNSYYDPATGSERYPERGSKSYFIEEDQFAVFDPLVLKIRAKIIMTKTLKQIIKQLTGLKLCLIGSANLKYQGIDIAPHDLDFLTDEASLNKVAKVFNCQISDNEDGYKECEFKIGNVDVHFVTESKFRTNQLDNTLTIYIDGIRVLAASLQSELEFYQKWNRSKDKIKIKLIKRIMISNGTILK